MKARGLEPLSPETQSLLATERNFGAEPAELRARVLARARASLGDVPATSSTSFWRRRMPLLLAAALVVTSAAAIAAWQKSRRTADRHATIAAATLQTHATPTPAVEPSSPAIEVPGAAPTSENDSARTEGTGIAPAPRRSAGDTTDADALELGLLQRARAAVARGEFSTALESIAEHQRRFPSGRLREEREALRIKALAGLGRNDEARRAAERFRERFPHSVLSNRIEETVRPTP